MVRSIHQEGDSISLSILKDDFGTSAVSKNEAHKQAGPIGSPDSHDTNVFP